MKISIHLFARAKDLAGTNVLTIELPQGATVGELRRRLAEERPVLAGILSRSALAVNNDFADEQLMLPAGAEIALLPPVSGG